MRRDPTHRELVSGKVLLVADSRTAKAALLTELIETDLGSCKHSCIHLLSDTREQIDKEDGHCQRCLTNALRMQEAEKVRLKISHASRRTIIASWCLMWW